MISRHDVINVNHIYHTDGPCSLINDEADC